MEAYIHGLKGSRGDPPRGFGSRGDPPVRGVVWGDPLFNIETRGPALGFSRGGDTAEVNAVRSGDADRLEEGHCRFSG